MTLIYDGNKCPRWPSSLFSSPPNSTQVSLFLLMRWSMVCVSADKESYHHSYLLLFVVIVAEGVKK
jgi:hypothetical protein